MYDRTPVSVDTRPDTSETSMHPGDVAGALIRIEGIP